MPTPVADERAQIFHITIARKVATDNTAAEANWPEPWRYDVHELPCRRAYITVHDQHGNYLGCL